MIETKELAIDLGGKEIKINIVSNSEAILTNSLTEEETPVWVELWPSSLALARWLWKGPSLAGQSVLELGAGLGLPGVVAAIKKGMVLQTDYIPEALEIAEQTAKLNKVSGIQTAVADWRQFEISEKFDFIIGSDIMYHPDLNPFLSKIFSNNLKPGGTVIMADAGRKDSILFIKSLVNEGWSVDEQIFPVTQDRFDYNIHLFSIQPLNNNL